MRSWFYETPICLQSKEFDLRFTVNKEVIVLMQASLKNSWTVIWTIFPTSTLPKSIKMTFMLYGEGTFMTLRTRTGCLKTGAVLQIVSKDSNYFMRRVCFQEWHIIVQYVRYGEIILAKKKNKRLLNFWRKYMTFKFKQWLNLRVQISLSFSLSLSSDVLLLVIVATKLVGGKF